AVEAADRYAAEDDAAAVHVFRDAKLNAAFTLFFFSSRRRHTRSTRDWSSDVCSSDLPYCPEWWHGRAEPECRRPAGRYYPGAVRSEERRVGKECRSRWSPPQ